MTKQIIPVADNQQGHKYEIKTTFLDPRTDFGFKKIFGTTKAKNDLIQLINAFGEGHIKPIKKLHLSNIEKTGATKYSRNALYDVHAEDPTNGKYDIEMQNQEIKYPIDREFFYLSMAIAESLEKGPEENFSLVPMTGVIIANFCIEKNAASPIINYIQYKSTYPKFPKPNVNILTIELPKFKLKIDELKSEKDVYLYIFNNLEELKTIPPQLDNEKYRPIFERARISNLNKKEMTQYLAYKKQEDKIRLANKFKEEVAETRGMTRGMTKGMTEGLTKGLTKGINKEASIVVKNLLQENLFDLEKIAEIVQLPIQQVRQIEKNLLALNA